MASDQAPLIAADPYEAPVAPAPPANATSPLEKGDGSGVFGSALNMISSVIGGGVMVQHHISSIQIPPLLLPSSPPPGSNLSKVEFFYCFALVM